MKTKEEDKEYNPKECEKCGEEIGILAVGDETYDYCKRCHWIIH